MLCVFSSGAEGSADEAAFLARAKNDDWPDFNIRQLTPHSGEKYVIEYIEPIDRNRAAVGLDIASEAYRKEAADAAAQAKIATDAALTATEEKIAAATEAQKSADAVVKALEEKIALAEASMKAKDIVERAAIDKKMEEVTAKVAVAQKNADAANAKAESTAVAAVQAESTAAVAVQAAQTQSSEAAAAKTDSINKTSTATKAAADAGIASKIASDGTSNCCQS